MTKHAGFTIINAIVDLLKLGKKRKQDLFDLLSDKYNKHQVEQGIKAALLIKVIKVPSLIKEKYHDQTTYMLVV